MGEKPESSRKRQGDTLGTRDEIVYTQDDLKQAFLAGWEKAFGYCNPDVGFSFGYPSTVEEAYKVWLKEQDDFK
jgi:hypothetical protein